MEKLVSKNIFSALLNDLTLQKFSSLLKEGRKYSCVSFKTKYLSKSHHPISFYRIKHVTGYCPTKLFLDRTLFLTLFRSSCTEKADYVIEESIISLLEKHEDIEKTEYILPQIRSTPLHGHNVFVIQPRVKWGPKKKLNTTADLQLAESVALAETVPEWCVVQKIIAPCLNPAKKFVFGTGNIKSLKEVIHTNPLISAVFLSCDMLTTLQLTTLEKEFGVPVYDRYSVVLHIFRDHARTKEAKLQIALAEIPYLRIQLKELHETGLTRESSGLQYIGGAGETYLENRKKALQRREMKIKSALEELKKQRNMLRLNRVVKEYPIVAIVGYTNSGKTSLIKALTDDDNLIPKDQLFATLDVTSHAGRLPSSQKVLYIDTVGFISDIPVSLIGSFSATLEDIHLADLVVHIMDISDPDRIAQKDNVLKTLQSLQLPSKLLDTIIEVGNKVDLVESESTDDNLLSISATRGDGLIRLQTEIEEGLMRNTGRLKKTFRVPSGGAEMRWLYKKAGIKAAIADPSNPNYLLMDTIVSKSVLSKFIFMFGDDAVCTDLSK